MLKPQMFDQILVIYVVQMYVHIQYWARQLRIYIVCRFYVSRIFTSKFFRLKMHKHLVIL